MFCGVIYSSHSTKKHIWIKFKTSLSSLNEIMSNLLSNGEIFNCIPNHIYHLKDKQKRPKGKCEHISYGFLDIIFNNTISMKWSMSISFGVNQDPRYSIQGSLDSENNNPIYRQLIVIDTELHFLNLNKFCPYLPRNVSKLCTDFSLKQKINSILHVDSKYVAKYKKLQTPSPHIQLKYYNLILKELITKHIPNLYLVIINIIHDYIKQLK